MLLLRYSYRAWFLDAVLVGGVYRFDPNGSQFCDFDLPGGFGGPFITAHNGALWLGNPVSSTLGRLTPTTNAYTFWPLSFGGGFPEPSGVTFAPNGDVWWADSGLGKIGFLQLATNRVTLFGPPGLLSPRQVDYQAGKVWFTDPFTHSLGVINPQTAVGLGPYVITPTTTTLVPACASVGSGHTSTAGVSTGMASFNSVVFTTTADAEGTLYTAPANGRPFGLAATGFDLWSTDTVRDRLVRVDTAAVHVYLPLVKR